MVMNRETGMKKGLMRKGSAGSFDQRWDDVSSALRGIGHVSGHFDAQDRLALRKPLQSRLGGLVTGEWVLSVWDVKCLRAVPAALWTEYLSFLVKKCGLSAEVVHEVVESPSVIVRADSACRWRIPDGLAARTIVKWEGNQAVLVPENAWIEIWEPKAKEALFMKALKAVEPMEALESSLTLPNHH